jgi:hypothetical protein
MIPASVFHSIIVASDASEQFKGNAMIELSVAVYPEIVEGSHYVHRQTIGQL